LRVLEEGCDETRLERIGLGDDRRRVVRDHDGEHPAVEGPGRLARLDRARRRLAEARVHEAVAREARCEYPGSESSPPSRRVGLEQSHPTRIELDLLARC